MEILHKIIPSYEVNSTSALFGYFEIIAGGKNCNNYHPIMECFSEKIWDMLPKDGVLPKDEAGNYKFSPGKMHKNFIKFYFLEMPLEYIILDVDDEEFEKMYTKELEKEIIELKRMGKRVEKFKKQFEKKSV